VSHMTTRVKGTRGMVSGACDVYSFGILLLELVSGRKPIERLPSAAKRAITEWADPLIARGRLGDLVNPRLRGTYDAAQLARVVECAALCVQGEPDRRPDMRTVVRVLRGESDAVAAGLGNGDQPVRMESVKYAKRLMDIDKSSEEDEEEEDIDDDEYSLMDDKSSMNFGAFGAMPVQTMQVLYAKRFSGNANAIKI
jgi:serine/threonine protein kinase